MKIQTITLKVQKGAQSIKCQSPQKLLGVRAVNAATVQVALAVNNASQLEACDWYVAREGDVVPQVGYLGSTLAGSTPVHVFGSCWTS